jgi:hypothetical protein
MSRSSEVRHAGVVPQDVKDYRTIPGLTEHVQARHAIHLTQPPHLLPPAGVGDLQGADTHPSNTRREGFPVPWANTELQRTR